MGDDQDRIWQELLERVRPTTALLLRRLRKQVGAVSWEEMMRHEQACFAFHEAEEQELALVRQEINQFLSS